MTLRREHCKYIGIQIGRGQYEEDPNKWSRSSGRTKAIVYFEWTYVRAKDGDAYRTSMSVNHLLHNARGPPKGPLSATASSGLTFTVDYAEALGKAVHEGIEFKGIAFEGEAPKLMKQLPKGGVDCQDEKVFWTMPDGRCVAYSLRELSYLREDDLAHQESHEANHATFSSVYTRIDLRDTCLARCRSGSDFCVFVFECFMFVCVLHLCVCVIC